MSTNRSRGLARLLFATWLAIAAASLLLAYLNRSISTDYSQLDSIDLTYVAGSTVFTFAFASMGALVAFRTNHPIGWLFLAVAILWMLSHLLEQYGARGVAVEPGSLPAARLALSGAWAALALAFAPLALILLLFPTGTLRSARWRPVVAVIPIAALLVAIPLTIWPGWSEWGLEIDNPIGLEKEAEGLLETITTVGVVLMMGVFVAGVISLVLRFRGSRGVERQQIKWLALLALAEAVILAGTIVAGQMAAGTEAENTTGSVSWGILVSTFMLGMPLAIGAAILRYRLYDIDRIFSRTLVYGTLTAGLALIYFGLVVGLQAALQPVSGGSDLAIALTTLIVAVLFLPARQRVQNAVDRRFNRRAYDAARTIEAFNARLRQQIDLDTLRYELLAVVDETMQPSGASLWVREREAK